MFSYALCLTWFRMGVILLDIHLSCVTLYPTGSHCL
jgi:hypothetical protein